MIGHNLCLSNWNIFKGSLFLFTFSTKIGVVEESLGQNDPGVSLMTVIGVGFRVTVPFLPSPPHL